ncbi:hypothetical protein BASA81_008900 [Batrachochytrium salamandrivorans]|nr:hypothetical protein BASA81_008900 [Batrachochytrium salamandrivorans]
MEHIFHQLPQPTPHAAAVSPASSSSAANEHHNSLAHHFALGLFPPNPTTNNDNSSSSAASSSSTMNTNNPGLFDAHELMDHNFEGLHSLTGTLGTSPQPLGGGHNPMQHSPFSPYNPSGGGSNPSQQPTTLSRPSSLNNMPQFPLPNTTLSRVGSFHNAFTAPYPFTQSQQPSGGGGGNGTGGAPTANFPFAQFATPSATSASGGGVAPPYLKDGGPGGPFPMFQSTNNSNASPTPHHHLYQSQPLSSLKKRTASSSSKGGKPPKMEGKQMRMEGYHLLHHLDALGGIPGPPPLLDDDHHSDVMSNRPRSRMPSSAYRGVSKCSKDGRWQARIRVKRHVTYLGRFVKEEDAARRYDEAAREHHGDKAVLNFTTPQDLQVGRKQALGVDDLPVDGEEEDEPATAAVGRGSNRTRPDQDLPPIE